MNKKALEQLKNERKNTERVSMKNINELKEIKERKSELLINYDDNYFNRISELSKRSRVQTKKVSKTPLGFQSKNNVRPLSPVVSNTEKMKNRPVWL